MTDRGELRDRVLEHALGEHFRRSQPVDLAPRIADAWERGVRVGDADVETPLNGSPLPHGTSDGALDAARPAPSEPATVEQRGWTRRAAAAAFIGAGLVAAAGFLFTPLIFDANPSPPVPEPNVAADLDGGGGPGSDAQPTPEEIGQLAKLFGLCTGDPTMGIPPPWGYPELDDARAEMLALLASSPPLWSELEDRTRAHFEAKNFENAGARWLLDLLVESPDPHAFELARDLWMERPYCFRVEHVLAFAERGAFELLREVEIMVAEHDEDDPAPAILSAALLALQGRNGGSQLLVRWLDSEATAKNGELYLTFVAVAGLEALGETGYQRVLFEDLDLLVEDSLERGIVDRARGIVVAADYFETTWRMRDRASVGILAARLRGHGRTLEGSLETSEQIRAHWGAIYPR